MATKKPSHRQPNRVANEEPSHRQPKPVDKSLHRQPHRLPNRVAQNTEEHIKTLGIQELLKTRFSFVQGYDELVAVMLECMTDEQAVEMLEQVEARYQAEGLQLPALPVVINDMILMHSARHLEEPPQA